MDESAANTLGLVVALAMYVLTAYPLYVIGKKTGESNPWFAFVPLLNLVLMVQIAGKDWWWLLLCFVPCVNVIVYALIWMDIADAMDKPSWWGLGMLVPGINVIVPWILAFA